MGVLPERGPSWTSGYHGLAPLSRGVLLRYDSQTKMQFGEYRDYSQLRDL